MKVRKTIPYCVIEVGFPEQSDPRMLSIYLEMCGENLTAEEKCGGLRHRQVIRFQTKERRDPSWYASAMMQEGRLIHALNRHTPRKYLP